MSLQSRPRLHLMDAFKSGGWRHGTQAFCAESFVYFHAGSRGNSRTKMPDNQILISSMKVYNEYLTPRYCYMAAESPASV
ncbi:predicted protein [Sclerotinia sclerotiorum 1980 UF-70]|uniref:Uncharacterized protein n=2 Tax=Sclerotinia sclerotiorum (strain ATCC 18683 / 1980 / Ss-1) TaxID=665079 RepID=A7EC46_SCLS1|nr:predicted protein [Sclerotinia sclerotiorum 1980 UF-70]APA09015.1 hypothetical protein sscle_04g037850 [Sclerotinia sclerotiorum 1980 UF-70]EDO00025.1 predicted protein [Sclerotinia sclerotiorum 1980 UF-70]